MKIVLILNIVFTGVFCLAGEWSKIDGKTIKYIYND